MGDERLLTAGSKDRMCFNVCWMLVSKGVLLALGF